MKLWPSVNKEKLKDGVRAANKSCMSKLRLSPSSEVNSSDQVKFSSACPMQSTCCGRTFHTPPHSMYLHKREGRNLLTLATVLFISQADCDSLEQRETAAEACLK